VIRPIFSYCHLFMEVIILWRVFLYWLCSVVFHKWWILKFGPSIFLESQRKPKKILSITCVRVDFRTRDSLKYEGVLIMQREMQNESACYEIVSVKLQTIKHILRYYIVYHRDNLWLFVLMTLTCMRIVKPLFCYYELSVKRSVKSRAVGVFSLPVWPPRTNTQ
jgi:hypothetical protein